MMHALALALGAGGRVPAWSPSALGSSLLGWWDAEDASTITTSGSAVSSWRDKVGGYDAVQAVNAARPTYSATSFNNRPGVTFDGVDDCLGMASVPFPTGANASEIWALVDQQALPADTGARVVMLYGGDTSSTRRGAYRTVNAGVSRLAGQAGDGAATQQAENLNASAFEGRKIVRAVISPTQTRGDLDNVAGGAVSSVPATGTVRTRIGANTASSASAFWLGRLSALLVTQPLSADQATQLYAYLNARRA